MRSTIPLRQRREGWDKGREVEERSQGGGEERGALEAEYEKVSVAGVPVKSYPMSHL